MLFDRRRLAFVALALVVLLFQDGTLAFADTLEISVVAVSTSQRPTWLWFPLDVASIFHFVLTHELFEVTVTITFESDFPGGSIFIIVGAPNRLFTSGLFEFGSMKKGESISLKSTFETPEVGTHCIRLGFQSLLERADTVTFLMGGAALRHDSCIALFTAWTKGDFFAWLCVGIFAVGVILTVIGLLVQRKRK